MKEQLIENLRLQKEIVLCEDDPIYFMSMYVNVAHPTHGSMLFMPHPWQERYIEDISKGSSVVAAARLAGSSVTTTLYLFWEGFFQKKQQVFTSNNINHSIDNLQTIRHAYMTMPVWMRDSNPMVQNTKTRIEFANGSRFSAVTAMEHSLRGIYINTLFIDNFSLIRAGDSFLTENLPSLIQKRSNILVVNPGHGNETFNDMFSDAQKGYGSFKAVRIVPDY